eukprot:2785300-Pyramimonas_sp.AAC.1
MAGLIMVPGSNRRKPIFFAAMTIGRRNSEADRFGCCGFADPGLSDPHGPMDVGAPKDGGDDAVEQERANPLESDRPAL